LSLPKQQKTDQDSPAAKVGRSMIVIGPVLTVLILSTLPSAVGLYWLASSAFSIFQQLIINKSLKHESGVPGENKKIS
jgi:membrane protein insertase Oxa1/YidC/SpoIIIJ